MRRILRSTGIFVTIALLLLASVPAWALDPTRNIAQFKHTRWMVDDGAPQNIAALAQTPDGFLWIGASTGLYRFDGITFERVSMIGDEPTVTALRVVANGDLWIGLLSGRVIQIHDGKQIDRTPSVRAKRIQQFEQDKAGGIWLRTGAYQYPLVRFANEHWTEFGPPQGIPVCGDIFRIFAAGDGSLYALTWPAPARLHRLRPGAAKFEELSVPVSVDTGLAEDAKGRIWLTDGALGTRLLDAPAQDGRHVLSLQDAGVLRQTLIDTDGNLWGTRLGGGIFRVSEKLLAAATAAPDDLREEIYAAKDGLSSDYAQPILQDKEGDIWVGSALGLDRFRPANLVVEPGIERNSKYGYILLAGQDGKIFAADSDSLYVVPPGGRATAILHNVRNPEALCETPNGDVWLEALHQLFVIRGGEAPQATPNFLPTAAMNCQADQAGQLWFLSQKGDFARRDGNDWKWFQTHQSGSDKDVTFFTFDRAGRRIGFVENSGLTLFDGAQERLLWPYGSVPGGRIGVLYAAGDATLVGAVSGLARLRGDKVTVLASNNPWLQHTTGIAQTPEGDTWFETLFGIFRVRTSALNAAFDNPQHVLMPEAFDYRDGLPGPNVPDFAYNSAVHGGDGRVWFVTASGIVWIDPAHLVHNPIPPPVLVTRAVIDGKVEENPQQLVLPAGARNVEIDYAGLSLQRPQDVRFRYRLAGSDTGWVDPGARRAAFYSNLAPGSYRFTVIAANADGVWNNIGATLSLRANASFYQTVWFAAFCALAALAVLFGVYAIRVRHLARSMREKLAERLAERERIARELHDTLLQGFHGLVLRFQSVANRIPPEQELRPLLEKALERAEETLVEGRNRVRMLRETAVDGNLSSMLSNIAEDLADEFSQTFQLSTEGTARRLHPMVLEELRRIAGEAIRNAFQHAKATRIQVSVVYARNELRLGVQDNGTGFCNKVAQQKRIGGHFGLTGMRERADRVGGRLFISSKEGAGTEVYVAIPGGRAYLPAPMQGRLLRILPLRSEIPGL